MTNIKKPRYKLIKTYPNSPELGYTLLPKPGGYYWKDEPFNPEDYPNNWELIDVKNYEILSFSYPPIWGDRLAVKKDTGFYKLQGIEGERDGWTLDDLLSNGVSVESNDVFIHSVKRLSDGEIFTLGDFVKRDGHTVRIGSIDIDTYWLGNMAINENIEPYGGECINTLVKSSEKEILKYQIRNKECLSIEDVSNNIQMCPEDLKLLEKVVKEKTTL